MNKKSEHGNTIVFDEVAKSGFSEQIKIGQMNTIMTKTSDQIHQVFGSRFSPKTDYIHMKGHLGQKLYTRAIIEAIESTLVWITKIIVCLIYYSITYDFQ